MQPCGVRAPVHNPPQGRETRVDEKRDDATGFAGVCRTLSHTAYCAVWFVDGAASLLDDEADAVVSGSLCCDTVLLSVGNIRMDQACSARRTVQKRLVEMSFRWHAVCSGTEANDATGEP